MLEWNGICGTKGFESSFNERKNGNNTNGGGMNGIIGDIKKGGTLGNAGKSYFSNILIETSQTNNIIINAPLTLICSKNCNFANQCHNLI